MEAPNDQEKNASIDFSEIFCLDCLVLADGIPVITYPGKESNLPTISQQTPSFVFSISFLELHDGLGMRDRNAKEVGNNMKNNGLNIWRKGGTTANLRAKIFEIAYNDTKGKQH